MHACRYLHCRLKKRIFVGWHSMDIKFEWMYVCIRFGWIIFHHMNCISLKKRAVLSIHRTSFVMTCCIWIVKQLCSTFGACQKQKKVIHITEDGENGKTKNGKNEIAVMEVKRSKRSKIWLYIRMHLKVVGHHSWQILQNSGKLHIKSDYHCSTSGSLFNINK